MSRYNFFNWAEKALLVRDSSRGLRSNNDEGADEPSVVLDERVKLEEAMDWAYEETEETEM